MCVITQQCIIPAGCSDLLLLVQNPIKSQTQAINFKT